MHASCKIFASSQLGGIKATLLALRVVFLALTAVWFAVQLGNRLISALGTSAICRCGQAHTLLRQKDGFWCSPHGLRFPVLIRRRRKSSGPLAASSCNPNRLNKRQAPATIGVAGSASSVSTPVGVLIELIAQVRSVTNDPVLKIDAFAKFDTLAF
jgi:hypothetical protein